MSINEVRDRLDAAAEQYAGPLNCQWMATDIRALLDDHARLQAAHADSLKAMRQAVIALAYAQEMDSTYSTAYQELSNAIDAAKAVQP